MFFPELLVDRPSFNRHIRRINLTLTHVFRGESLRACRATSALMLTDGRIAGAAANCAEPLTSCGRPLLRLHRLVVMLSSITKLARCCLIRVV